MEEGRFSSRSLLSDVAVFSSLGTLLRALAFIGLFRRSIMVISSRATLRDQAGVKLVRIERLAKQQRLISFKLSSHRNGSQRLIADEAEAHRAFAREVAASLQDPVVVGLIERGVLPD
ncbi:hypothetical protein [Brevundimonas diminuta]|uniref:hypothetical protein n=1 Tax=Brevundimonas diminuta TaxID=293 RepID=UPI0030F8D1D7